MKKLATTFGLLALMLVVTSFTTPNEIGGKNSQGTLEPNIFSIGGKNSQGTLQPCILSIGGKNSQGTLEPN